MLLIWFLKEARLLSLKKCFLSLSGEQFCGSFEVLIEKKIGKWSERSDLIMPFFKDSLKIFVVMTLSIIVADFLATRVSFFIKAIARHSNSELQKVETFSFSKYSTQFMLRSPIRYWSFFSAVDFLKTCFKKLEVYWRIFYTKLPDKVFLYVLQVQKGLFEFCKKDSF